MSRSERDEELAATLSGRKVIRINVWVESDRYDYMKQSLESQRTNYSAGEVIYWLYSESKGYQSADVGWSVRIDFVSGDPPYLAGFMDKPCREEADIEEPLIPSEPHYDLKKPFIWWSEDAVVIAKIKRRSLK